MTVVSISLCNGKSDRLLENYFADFSRQIDHDHLIRIVQKTWKKMSPRAHELALGLPMSDEARALVEEALAG